MTHGDVLEYTLGEGDEFMPGDLLAEIQTDKASIGFEMQEEGYIAKIVVPAGTEGVEVGTTLAIAVEEEEDIAAFANYVEEEGASDDAPTPPEPESDSSAAPTAAPTTTATTTTTTVSSSGSDERVFSSPAARKIAADHGLDVNQIPGTGPKGRIIKADVLEFVASGGTTQAAAEATATTTAPPPPPPAASGATYVDIPVTSLRKVVANKLTQSKTTVPHYYVTVDVTMDNLMALRKNLNEQNETKISVNDFVMKAAALAMAKVPEVNSQWHGDIIRQFNDVHINVAVAVDDGLVSPIIRNVDKVGLTTINADVKAVAERARDGNLLVDDVEIGTFTISNLGMFGVSDFCAIITPPQACVLAIGGASTKFVPHPEDGSPQAVSKMSATLSSDHRVVDGAVAAKWLNVFKGYLENPMSMLL